MKKSCILLVFSIIVGILMCGFVQIEDDELTAQEIANEFGSWKHRRRH
jgi:hypothetical protein